MFARKEVYIYFSDVELYILGCGIQFEQLRLLNNV